MHTPHLSRRASFWLVLWSGGCYCRCDLRLHCWIRVDLYFKPLNHSTSMASSYWRQFSLLSWPQNFPIQTCRTSDFSQGKRTRWVLCLNVFPDDHKSHDNPVFCGDICWIGSRKRQRELCFCGNTGLRCIYRFDPMVVYFKQLCHRVSCKVQPSQVALGKQNFRHNHYGIRSYCPPGLERINAQLHVATSHILIEIIFLLKKHEK